LKILEITDSSFWHQPNQGVGSFKILNSDEVPLYTFDPDFGGSASFEFGIGNITKIDDLVNPFLCVIYPNPSSDILNIKINGNGNNTVKARLTNSVGLILIEKNGLALRKRQTIILI